MRAGRRPDRGRGSGRAVPMSVSPTRPVSAVIPAGGVGVRMGGDRPKQWLDLAGISILERSIRIFDVCAQVGEIVVALPPGSLALELRGTCLLYTSPSPRD